MYYAGMVSTASPIRPKARRFDSPQQEVFLSLWRTYDRLRRSKTSFSDVRGLTRRAIQRPSHFEGGLSPKSADAGFKRRLISRVDITRLLDKLAERGLIERERGPIIAGSF